MQTLLAPVARTINQDQALELVRHPVMLAKAAQRVELRISQAESPLGRQALEDAAILDAIYEQLVAAVLAENPELAERARYKARLAETAHQAYLEGTVPLGLRNRHASAAADLRAEVLELAQRYLDKAGAGYMSNGGIKELHHVA